MSSIIEFNEKQIKSVRCPVSSCKKELLRLKATFSETGSLVFECECVAGHKSTLTYQPPALKVDHPKQALVKSIRTKISGVTHENPGGVKRQELLKHVSAGDSLVIKSEFVDGKRVLSVYHAIGQLGTVKWENVRSVYNEAVMFPEKGLQAKVTTLTGGQGEKPTIGCNIEVFQSQIENPVYLDPDGKNIYHKNPQCSGLMNAKEIPLEYAKNVLNARPCKKCAENKGG